jgi:hypothetical protein
VIPATVCALIIQIQFVDMLNYHLEVQANPKKMDKKTDAIFSIYGTHCLGMTYYVNFLGGLGSNEFHIKWQLKKSKSWGPFWSCQLNSTANSAHSARFLGKWAKLAVLFSW